MGWRVCRELSPRKVVEFILLCLLWKVQLKMRPGGLEELECILFALWDLIWFGLWPGHTWFHSPFWSNQVTTQKPEGGDRSWHEREPPGWWVWHGPLILFLAESNISLSMILPWVNFRLINISLLKSFHLPLLNIGAIWAFLQSLSCPNVPGLVKNQH